MTGLKSTPSEATVIVEDVYSAPVSKVYEAWTKAESFVKWFGRYEDKIGTATLDVKVGGGWRFDFASDGPGRIWFEGKYTRVEANKALGFTWKHVEVGADGTRQETSVSEVNVLFSADGDQTRVMLHHSSIQTEGGRAGVGRGWTSSLERLRTVVSSG